MLQDLHAKCRNIGLSVHMLPWSANAMCDDDNFNMLPNTESFTLRAKSAAAADVAAARASGGTKGLQVGTRSSSRLWAKKQMCRRHFVPSLHSCVRYLHARKDHSWCQMTQQKGSKQSKPSEKVPNAQMTIRQPNISV